MKHSDFEKDKKKTSQKENSPELLGMTQNIMIDNIQEHFPALHTELTAKKMSLGISEVKSGVGLSPKQYEGTADPLSNYDPDIFDFLARATTDEEGYEIIDFLTKQGQISAKNAQKIRNQIKSSGIRSFGPERSKNHYFRKAGEIRNRRIIEKRYSIQTNEDANK